MTLSIESIVLSVIALLIIAEGIVVLSAQKQIRAVLRALARTKQLYVYGIIELLVGIVLLLIAVTIRNS